MPTEMEDYLFDLKGYLILENAITPGQLGRINQWIDDAPPLKNDEWLGHVQAQSYHGEDGINYQNIIEGGDVFEELIDHPSWVEHCRKYIGKDDQMYIDEDFINVRGPGGFICIHSGGDRRTIRTQYRYHNNRWHCGQINIIVALNDIGPGDGGTVIIPGSHKSNVPHPMLAGKYADVVDKPGSAAEGTMEVHLKAGQALMFVDCLCHGSSERINAGNRRVLIYRYSPRWGRARFGYEPSEELLARLTPERQQIVQPIKPRRPNMSSSGV